MGIQDIFGQMAETLGGAAGGVQSIAGSVQDIIADPQSTIGEIAGQAIDGSGISDIANGLGENIAENIPGLEGLDPTSVVEGLGGASESLEGAIGDLGGILEGSPLEEAAGNLGGILEDSPLGGIVEGLGGLFGGRG